MRVFRMKPFHLQITVGYKRKLPTCNPNLVLILTLPNVSEWWTFPCTRTHCTFAGRLSNIPIEAVSAAAAATTHSGIAPTMMARETGFDWRDMT